LTEFRYEDPTFLRPAIITIDYAESLRYNYSYNSKRSFTPSKGATIGQDDNEDNTSKKNKSRVGENNQQSL
jgi:hypothetical protein